MGRDNIYWLFSASAQAISALFAFLLAGFALVQAMMESAQQRDDTLQEVHTRLQRDYYRRLVLLAVVTGTAIILSLALVFVNPLVVKPLPVIVGFVALLDITAIVGAIWFVVWIINPDRYMVAAKELIKEGKQELGLAVPTADPATFFTIFVQLEKIIRSLLKRKRLYEPSVTTARMSYSFRQMIDALYQSEIISQDFYNELQQINKYRNIIFHGHENRVDESMLQRTIAALAQAKVIDKRNLKRPRQPTH